MLLIAILLMLTGAVGLFGGMNAFGDIGFACIVAGAGAMLSGIGMLIARGKIRKLYK